MPAMARYLDPPHQGMEAMVATNEMSPDSSTIEMDKPSTPIRYSMLKALIQVKCCTSCTPVACPLTSVPAADGSYQCQAASAQASDPPLVTMAMMRDAWSSAVLDSPARERTAAKRTMSPSPSNGKKVAQLRTFC